MEADNENYQTNDVERDSDACGHEFDHGSDHGNSHGSSSDDKNSVNDYDYDSEQRNASRYLAVLSCTTDVLPRRGLLMQTLCRSNPVFKRVRFASVQDECFKFYEDIKVDLKPLLRNLDGQISLSVDILSCRKFCEYMCLKAHFIDKDWNLMNLVLNFHRISEVGDDCIVEAILKVLKDWDIGNKIANITFLTGSVENKEIDEIKDYVQETKKLQFNGQRFRLFCCADIFKRMVQDAFEAIWMTIPRIDFQMYFGKPSSGSRWDAVYDRLKMALEREAKEEFKEEYDRDKPSADELKRVECICKLLESLYNAARAVFETKDSTAGIYFQNLQEVRATLTKETNSSDSFIRDVATEMHKRFEKYWKKMFLVLAIATVMDPRYKITYFEFSSSKYGGKDGNTEVSTVLMAIRSLYDDYNTRFPDNENPVSNRTSSNSESETPRPVKRGCLSSDASKRLQDYQQFIESTNQPLKSELDLYLEEPVLPWTQDFNILSWWRAASPRYPILSRIARDYLSVPVSVVTSIDEFFTMERGISPRRYASFKPDLINAIMCTQSWVPTELKSMAESSLGFGEMLEDIKFVDELI